MQDVEKELEVQIGMKQEMEMSMKMLEKDICEKQDALVELRQQLEDLRAINQQLSHKSQVRLPFCSSHFTFVQETCLTCWFVCFTDIKMSSSIFHLWCLSVKCWRCNLATKQPSLCVFFHTAQKLLGSQVLCQMCFVPFYWAKRYGGKMHSDLYENTFSF